MTAGRIMLTAGLLGLSLVDQAQSQSSQPKFESGEIIVGFKSQGDREQGADQLNATISTFTVQGQKVENVQVVPISGSAVKLRVSLPQKMEVDPSSELHVLQEMAAQIKNSDSRIKYAHPNWILDKMSLTTQF